MTQAAQQTEIFNAARIYGDDDQLAFDDVKFFLRMLTKINTAISDVSNDRPAEARIAARFAAGELRASMDHMALETARYAEHVASLACEVSEGLERDILLRLVVIQDEWLQPLIEEIQPIIKNRREFTGTLPKSGAQK